jgi:hypothetical protein
MRRRARPSLRKGEPTVLASRLTPKTRFFDKTISVILLTI